MTPDPSDPRIPRFARVLFGLATLAEGRPGRPGGLQPRGRRTAVGAGIIDSVPPARSFQEVDSVSRAFVDEDSEVRLNRETRAGEKARDWLAIRRKTGLPGGRPQGRRYGPGPCGSGGCTIPGMISSGPANCWRFTRRRGAFRRPGGTDALYRPPSQAAPAPRFCPAGLRAFSDLYRRWESQQGRRAAGGRRSYPPSRRGRAAGPLRDPGLLAGRQRREDRKAYRAGGKYHPDKFIGLDLDKEFVDLAAKRFQEVQEAYEHIRRSRGFV